MSQERSELVFLNSHDIPVPTEFSWVDEAGCDFAQPLKHVKAREVKALSKQVPDTFDVPAHATSRKRLQRPWLLHAEESMDHDNQVLSHQVSMHIDRLDSVMQEVSGIMHGRSFHNLEEEDKDAIRQKLAYCVDIQPENMSMEGPVYGFHQLRPIRKPAKDSRGVYVLMVAFVNFMVLCMHGVLVSFAFLLGILGIPHSVSAPRKFPPLETVSLRTLLFQRQFTSIYQCLRASLPQLWRTSNQASIPMRDRVLYISEQFALTLRTSALPQQCAQFSQMMHAVFFSLRQVMHSHLPFMFYVMQVFQRIHALGVHVAFFRALYISVESLVVIYETLSRP